MDAATRKALLMELADRLDRVASTAGSTELIAWQIMRPLGVGTVNELPLFKSRGLPCYRRDGQWYIDTRDFRRWASSWTGTTPNRSTGNRPDARRGFGGGTLF